jgi:hypothetical protein
MLRFAIDALTHDPPMPVAKVARLVSQQITRNEEARRARWKKRGLRV